MKSNEIIKTEQDLKCLGYHITNDMIKSIDVDIIAPALKSFVQIYA